jgi:hypothetical protein
MKSTIYAVKGFFGLLMAQNRTDLKNIFITCQEIRTLEGITVSAGKQKIALASLALLITCLIIGYLVTLYLGTINSVGRIATEIPVNPIVFVPLAVSAWMAFVFFRSKRLPKRTKVSVLLFITIYAAILYFMSKETSKAVTFNVQDMNYLTLFVYLFAALPFYFKRVPFRFSADNAGIDFMFFSTMVMWLSPLVCELCILFRWVLQGVFFDYIRTMTLGAMGLSDVLFFYGFWVFLATALFAIFSKSVKTATPSGHNWFHKLYFEMTQ